jgi:beta-galactosidase
MLDGVYSFYKPLFEANVPVDFVHPEGDLSRYRIVIAPNLYLVSDGAAGNIKDFVAGGGTLVMSFFSGIVDENEHIRLGGYPAPFRELLGLFVEDFVPFAAGEANRLATPDGASYSCDLWADLVHLEGAEPIATYERGFYAGTPAVTRHASGGGTVYYLGTLPEERYTKEMLAATCREAGVEAPLEAPPGVEVVRRKTGGASFLFVLNHGDQSVEVRLPRPARDLLTGTEHGGELTLEPMGVAVLEEAGR